jgi:hypothetical protein
LIPASVSRNISTKCRDYRAGSCRAPRTGFRRQPMDTCRWGETLRDSSDLTEFVSFHGRLRSPRVSRLFLILTFQELGILNRRLPWTQPRKGRTRYCSFRYARNCRPHLALKSGNDYRYHLRTIMSVSTSKDLRCAELVMACRHGDWNVVPSLRAGVRCPMASSSSYAAAALSRW